MPDNLKQTQGTIDRILLLERTMRPVLFVISAVNAGLGAGILGAILSSDYWLLFALAGVLVGLGLGFFLAGALSVLLEWMVQVLLRVDRKP